SQSDQRGVDPREGVPGPADAALASALSALRLRSAQGLRDRGAPRRTGAARAVPDPSPQLRALRAVENGVESGVENGVRHLFRLGRGIESLHRARAEKGV